MRHLPTNVFLTAFSLLFAANVSHGRRLESRERSKQEESYEAGTGGHIIATYLGALPAGSRAPELSTITSEVNLIMLSFAKDNVREHNGNFEPFSEWVRLGITYDNIAADKARNPDRKYLISLGGSANYGGTFSIIGSVDSWVDNADRSIAKIVDGFDADGVEIQFEGGTGDSNFVPAITSLLQRLKNRGFVTAIGPFYGGTWGDYMKLPMDNVDYVNCQFFAKDLQTVESVVNDIRTAAKYLGSWSKLIAGFNSNGRNPNPSTSLLAVYQLKNNLRGIFTWDAEHSQNNSPSYCIERNAAKILDENQEPGSCNW